MSRSPKMVTGPKSAATRANLAQQEQEEQQIRPEILERVRKEEEDQRPAPAKKTLLMSRYRNHLIQIVIEDDTVLGKRVVKGKNHAVRFSDYMAKVSNDDLAILKAMPNFGIGREMWVAQDAVRANVLSQSLGLAETLRANVALIQQAAGSDDFELQQVIADLTKVLDNTGKRPKKEEVA